MLNGHSATVLVALAVTESSPSQIKVGKVISVPPPANELIPPASECDHEGDQALRKSEGVEVSQRGHRGNLTLAQDPAVPQQL